MKKNEERPEPVRQYRMTYHTTHPDGRVFERSLTLLAPNSRAALSKGLRLLMDGEKNWKISQFEQVWPEPGPVPDLLDRVNATREGF